MFNNLAVVGTIKFDKRLLNVYVDLDNPIFRAADIADMIDYSDGNSWKMLQMCEEDEKLLLPLVVAGQTRQVAFVTETGLYNILAQSRKPIARKWRRVIHNELIRMRKEKNQNVVEQFGEWDKMLDNVYWDEERGMLMMSVTVAGGDVEQVPYVPKTDGEV
jgi:prophage antirepressor-like protein